MTGFVIGSNPGYRLTLIDNVLVLTNLRLEMNSYAPGSAGSFTTASFAAGALIFPSIFTGEFNFLLEIKQTKAEGWQIDRINAAYNGEVKLSDLVKGIVGNTAMLPAVLAELRFANFGVNVVRVGKAFSYTLYGEANTSMPIMDTTLIASLQAVATYSPDGYNVSLQGTFLIGDQNFQLKLDLGNSGTKAPASPTIIMQASWQALDPAAYLQFEDIAQALGFPESEIPTIPRDLDLNLKQANFYYDYTNQQLLVGCVSDKLRQRRLRRRQESHDQEMAVLLRPQHRQADTDQQPAADRQYPAQGEHRPDHENPGRDRLRPVRGCAGEGRQPDHRQARCRLSEGGGHRW